MSATTIPFMANPAASNLFKQEYGFYWERARKDEAGRIVKTEDWSTDERKAAAKSGAAMKDGSFPINKAKDVKDAVDDWGRAGAKPSVKDHIKARAKSIDCTHMLPDDWQDDKGGHGATNQNTNADSTAA